jgi:hypothetical protein
MSRLHPLEQRYIHFLVCTCAPTVCMILSTRAHCREVVSIMNDNGTLSFTIELRNGLCYSPRKFEFGEAPADEHELVKAFLKTDRFVVTSLNAYNQLGLGTTQLYNKRVVYNQKRHGTFPLGNRMVTFERRLNVPRQLSPEFLLVDLVNKLRDLAEDRDAVVSRVREKAKEMDPRKLSRAVSLYGKSSTQKTFQEMLEHALTLFCMSEAISRRLSRPLPTTRRSMIRPSWKKTTGSCTPSLGSNSLA